MPKAKFIYVIGAGQIGSRHFQALKRVACPLRITVIDPSQSALDLARARYQAAPPGKYLHEIRFRSKMARAAEAVDLAIIATTAEVRANIIKKLVKTVKVRYLLLEKLLFQKKQDYSEISLLLKKRGIKAWVNCNMRQMPFYQKIKKNFPDRKVSFSATLSKFGLVTNAIHYLDYVFYLTGSRKFTIDTSLLAPYLVASKRKQFPELSGSLLARFENGSRCLVTHYDFYESGEPHVEIKINGSQFRCKTYDLEQKGWAAEKIHGWKWRTVKVPVPFQSETTTTIAENILRQGNCVLPSFEDSRQIHLQLLEPLRRFLNNAGQRYDFYPFT